MSGRACLITVEAGRWAHCKGTKIRVTIPSTTLHPWYIVNQCEDPVGQLCKTRWVLISSSLMRHDELPIPQWPPRPCLVAAGSGVWPLLDLREP